MVEEFNTVPCILPTESQNRILSVQIQDIKNHHSYFMKKVWTDLTSEEKDKIWEIRRKRRCKYINKFNWLWKKQKLRRSDLRRDLKKNIDIFPKPKTLKNRKDRMRKQRRNKLTKIHNLEQSVKENILNKSDTKLNFNDLLLLNHGLNFVPTPNWSESIEKSEWFKLFQHKRRMEGCFSA